MTLDLTKFKVYAVGGYVRDRILGLQPKDHDYVVVGATPDDMIAAGFEPIAAAFPIFIEPRTRDEYALARKERKTGVGYHGFVCEFDPTVTLEEDLYRRDLTMNAMAREVIGWNDVGYAKLSDDVIDPYGGMNDITSHMLRHVSYAFAEDPVRVLRAARFAARYGFDVHPDTKQLMWEVSEELNHVPQERIWAEIEKGLSEDCPWTMFDVLDECGALDVEALKAYRFVDLLRMRELSADTPDYVRFCLVGIGFEDKDYERCRIPTDLARVSKAFNNHFVDLFNYTLRTAEERVVMFESLRAFSNPNSLLEVLNAMRMYHEFVDVAALEDTVMRDLTAALTVEAAHIASQCKTGVEIKRRLFDARVAAVSHK